MVNDPVYSDTETIGQFLHRHRTENGIDLAEATNETKIPTATLKAMEEGDYAALPADAFARGFYAIYARHLRVDADYVLEQYEKERSSSPKTNKKMLRTPSKLGEEFSPMAERPMFSPVSVMGAVLVIIVLLASGVCWYFSWNPARLISNELRNFGKQPVIEQPKSRLAQAPAEKSITVPVPSKSAAVGEPKPTPKAAAPAATVPDTVKWKYTVVAQFQDPTQLTVVVDDDFPEELKFTAGESHEWHPKKSVTFTLPGKTTARLSLNGAPVPLPAPVGGFITVTIPGPGNN